MHVAKEAILSSKIEGTRTEFDELFLKEEEVDPERRDDWTEVQNYTKAMSQAIKNLEKLPLSMGLVKETHAILMSGVRGKNKHPGEVRISQNWIGGSGLKDAFFIPPHKDELPDLLTDLEKFWNNADLKIPELIKAAIGHYQFETIHPFLDGNGRLGRLLITLYLMEKKCLVKPILYLSDFFQRNKGAYFESFTVVRHSNDLKHWLMFFLTGVIETSNNSKKTFDKIIMLRSKIDEEILGLGKRAKIASKLIKNYFSKPILDINQIADYLSITHQSASKLVDALQKAGILREITGFKRNRLFSFQAYLDIFE